MLRRLLIKEGRLSNPQLSRRVRISVIQMMRSQHPLSRKLILLCMVNNIPRKQRRIDLGYHLNSQKRNQYPLSRNLQPRKCQRNQIQNMESRNLLLRTKKNMRRTMGEIR